MKNNSSVLVINLYYPPDTTSTGDLLHQICSDLVSQGKSVHVLTGQPSYSGTVKRAASVENIDGVAIHRINLHTSNGRANIVTRFISYAAFMAKGWYLSLKLARKHQIDSVLTVSNPPTVGLLGRRVSKKLGVQFKYILFDIHPDAIEVANSSILSKLARPFWNMANRAIWDAATTIAVPGAYMKQYLIEKYKISSGKIEVLPLWGVPEIKTLPTDNAIRRNLGFKSDSLLVLHSGNIGLMHRMTALCEAVGTAAADGVEMAITGGGAASAEARKFVETKNYTNIKFLGYLPGDDFVHLMQTADIAASTLKDGMEKLSMPSRCLTYLSAGLPILALMNPKSDIGDLIAEEQCGWSAHTIGEMNLLLSRLSSDKEAVMFSGERAKIAYETRHSMTKSVRRYSKFALMNNLDDNVI